MSDTFEFDDNDDVLLNSICTPYTENTKPIKRTNQLNDENDDLLKKTKWDTSERSMSPVFPIAKRNTDGTAHLSENGSSKAIKRIFPGPAGILADGNMETCSPRTSSIFQDGPWEEMSKDFKISGSTYLYDSFNIAWIKKEAIANQFADQKAPFLAAILRSLEVSDGQTQKSVNVTLKDMTGSIQGNILYSLYQDYASHFILGSVLILVQFGVLSCTCDKCENHHLTITPKNLSAIYNNKTKIVIKKMVPDEILSEFCQRKKELALKARNHSLVKRNILSTASGMSFNNKTRPQNALSSKSLSSNDVEHNASTKERFPIFKLGSVSENSLENKASTSITNTNNNFKSFTFKKEPLAQILSSKNSNYNKSLTNINHKKAELIITGDRNTNIVNSNDNNCRDALKTRLEASNANENCNNSKSVKEPKRIFSFKKTYSPKETHSNTINSINEISNNRKEGIQNYASCSVINTTANEISVKADRSEHEELWKDVLNNVDINSFFDEDF